MPTRLSALTGRSSFICAQCRKALTAPKRRRLLSTSSKTPEIYDVVTVGGGPAGLALLAALSTLPRISVSNNTDQPPRILSCNITSKNRTD